MRNQAIKIQTKSGKIINKEIQSVKTRFGLKWKCETNTVTVPWYNKAYSTVKELADSLNGWYNYTVLKIN